MLLDRTFLSWVRLGRSRSWVTTKLKRSASPSSVFVGTVRVIPEDAQTTADVSNVTFLELIFDLVLIVLLINQLYINMARELTTSDFAHYKSLYDSDTHISRKVEFSGYKDNTRRVRAISTNFVSYIPACNLCVKLIPELTKCMHVIQH